MPVRKCYQNGKPGFQWGESGKCYTYTRNDKESRERARSKAVAQGQAIKAKEN